MALSVGANGNGSRVRQNLARRVEIKSEINDAKVWECIKARIQTQLIMNNNSVVQFRQHLDALQTIAKRVSYDDCAASSFCLLAPNLIESFSKTSKLFLAKGAEDFFLLLRGLESSLNQEAQTPIISFTSIATFPGHKLQEAFSTKMGLDTTSGMQNCVLTVSQGDLSPRSATLVFKLSRRLHQTDRLCLALQDMLREAFAQWEAGEKITVVDRNTRLTLNDPRAGQASEEIGTVTLDELLIAHAG
ncbi:MAG: hypothetical protein HQ564_10685 [Candidatus Saganbacteria bacterium]|nr:hypothetical protein [Candidatus Saganbacteria bacterium]